MFVKWLLGEVLLVALGEVLVVAEASFLFWDAGGVGVVGLGCVVAYPVWVVTGDD